MPKRRSIKNLTLEQLVERLQRLGVEINPDPDMPPNELRIGIRPGISQNTPSIIDPRDDLTLAELARWAIDHNMQLNCKND